MIGEAGVNRVRAALFWHANLDPNPLLAPSQAFKAKYKEDWNWLPTNILPNMVAAAMNKAGSADPLQVAIALEGLRYAGPTGEVWMRPEDHQLMMPIYETVFLARGRPRGQVRRGGHRPRMEDGRKTGHRRQRPAGYV